MIGVKKIDFDKLQEDAAYRAAYDIENTVADKKPSVLDQLKEISMELQQLGVDKETMIECIKGGSQHDPSH